MHILFRKTAFTIEHNVQTPLPLLFDEVHMISDNICRSKNKKRRIKMSKPFFADQQDLSIISNIQNQSSIINQTQSKRDIEYTIKINGPQGQQSLQTPTKKADESDKSQKMISHKNPYENDTSGYEINRELYSDEQIRQAFKVIDINKDGVLSYDDIAFFLKCLGEEFTQDEVNQMISMVSTDGKAVVLEDFKKIGKGQIIPFAAIKYPDESTQIKQNILKNMNESGLINFDPEDLIRAEETNVISFSKFQSQKSKNIQQIQIPIIETVVEQASILRNRSHAEIMQKRSIYLRIPMLNIERVIENLNNYNKQFIDSKEVAELITINQSQARQLFTDPYKRVYSKQILLDCILFSSQSPIQRLQLILININRTEYLIFDELLDILIYMIGSEQKQLIKRRLTNLLKQKRVALDAHFDKYYIIQLIGQQSSAFNW